MTTFPNADSNVQGSNRTNSAQGVAAGFCSMREGGNDLRNDFVMGYRMVPFSTHRSEAGVRRKGPLCGPITTRPSATECFHF